MDRGMHSSSPELFFKANGRNPLKGNVRLRGSDFIYNSNDRIRGMHQQLAVKYDPSSRWSVILISRRLHSRSWWRAIIGHYAFHDVTVRNIELADSIERQNILVRHGFIQ
jgi:hypothetical protein